MKDRIRQIMEGQHMTQKTFASFIGVSEGLLSSVFNGRTRPTLNIVEAIKNSFPTINTEWLMFGKGPMFSDSKDQAEGQAAATVAGSKEGELSFSGADTLPQPGRRDAAYQQSVGSTPNNPTKYDVKISDKPQRRITEIRVFYDDQTWESFVPKK